LLNSKRLYTSFLQHGFQEGLEGDKAIEVEIQISKNLIQLPLLQILAQPSQSQFQLMGTYDIFSPTKILKYFSELPLDLFIEVHPRIDTYHLTTIQLLLPSKYFLAKFIHLLLLDQNSLGFEVVLRLAKSELGLVWELLIEIVFLFFIAICSHHVLVPILLLSFHRNRVIIQSG